MLCLPVAGMTRTTTLQTCRYSTIAVREGCRTCREKQVLQWTVPTYTPLHHLVINLASFASDHRQSTLMDEVIQKQHPVAQDPV
jgi:hypothetical protein